MKLIPRVLLLVFALWLGSAGVQTQPPPEVPRPTLYLVSNSHLDTQWNWTVQDTIRQFVPSTFYDNFALFDRFPDYTFNYEGAIHYMWFKEYHPDAWPRLQKYVADGRWRLAGSWINAVDTNIPSPEALFRQALYGKRFFRQEFGKVPLDIYLPDCFGFGFALPSIGVHSGIRAFSTQKLSWGAARPTPFAVGLWEGPDGQGLVASLRAGDYVAQVRSNIANDPAWTGDMVTLVSGRKVGFRYFGVGDQGGAPDNESVEWVEKAVKSTTGAVEVRNVSADQLARDLTAAERASLPMYEGELLMKTHGVGCYTSQAAMKAFNRRNEQLADAAERASVAAEWVGGPAYPRERLRAAWTRFLWHQFHDDLTGTSIPQAYQFSWNDELISSNQFASVLTSAVAAVASGLDTRPAGHTAAPSGHASLVVYNALGVRRVDPVEATVQWPGPPAAAVRVLDTTTGADVPAQVLSTRQGGTTLVFLADLPPVGFKVYDVVRAVKPFGPGPLKVTLSSLENSRYVVRIDANGDVASIRDKEAGTELLKAPARLELFDDPSFRWPAWEILWDTVSHAPRAYAANPTVRTLEHGPVRVALEVTRTVGGSKIVQRIRLAQGGDRVEFDTQVDWRSPGTLLKASFPLTASSPRATYDLGLGTIERPNSTADFYEVPAQQWADLSDASGRFGVSVVNDSKYGWDKPSDNELRLTLIHTPRPSERYVYQSSNDIGHHHFIYAIAGHRGGWRDGCASMTAARLNQPLAAFQAQPHAGALGRTLGFLEMSDTAGQVAVRAFKKAEDSDELVIRVQELYGKPVSGVQIALPTGIRQAREINAAEEPVGEAQVVGGRLTFALNAYQPRTFAVVPAAPGARVKPVTSVPLALAFDLDGMSSESNRADGDFDGRGHTFPAEQIPESLPLGDVAFRFGPTTPGARNVMVAQVQRIALPEGSFSRVYILASAVGSDQHSTLTIERRGGAASRVPFDVQDWSGAIGQWDNRLRDDRMLRELFVPKIDLDQQSWTLDEIESQMVTRWIPPPTPPAAGQAAQSHPVKPAAPAPPARALTVTGLESVRPGFVKRDTLALVTTHRHSRQGDEPYIFGYVFEYAIDLPKGATAIVLPTDSRIRVFAVTAASEPSAPVRTAAPLYAPDLGRQRPSR
jgi:alpha-mannosidase